MTNEPTFTAGDVKAALAVLVQEGRMTQADMEAMLAHGGGMDFYAEPNPEKVRVLVEAQRKRRGRTAAERAFVFWTNVRPHSAPAGLAEDCLDWRGYRDERGYGHFRFNGRVWAAHRVAWELSVGPIPAGALLRHKCDRPACVNPAHIELGTHADNTRDRIERGRAVAPVSGPLAPGDRLNVDEVKAMRGLYAIGDITHAELAKMFGVTTQTTNDVLNRKTWKHVE